MVNNETILNLKNENESNMLNIKEMKNEIKSNENLEHDFDNAKDRLLSDLKIESENSKLIIKKLNEEIKNAKDE